ncbi:MAG: hypothetical protein LBH93_03100 [Chitinispirillales bacterium]|jgi:cell division septal protein FtsQ|nr:hypothetical protein [Chitinispirillales bacterium]
MVKRAPKRIGANRQKLIEERRVRRPQMVKRAALRFVKIAAAVAVLCCAVFSIFTYSPALYAEVTGAVKSSKKLPSEVRITNCSLPVQASLLRVVDSIARVDSFSLCRAEVIKAAEGIPEVEKVRVKRVGGGASKDKVTQIAVTERKPVAIVHSGKVFLVDKKGVRFSPCPGTFYDLPLLVYGGKAAGDTVDLKVFNMVKKAARVVGGAFFHDISQIDISNSSEVNLRFGSSDAEYTVAACDIDGRLVHVKELRERFSESGSEPARIDLRYRGLAFTTMR